MKNISMGYVWYSPTKDRLVGIDSGSGGYATFTVWLGSASIFNSIKSALEYREIWTRSGTDAYGYNADKWELFDIAAGKSYKPEEIKELVG